MTLFAQIKRLPSKPGVYLFYNQKGQIIYIGKAVNLKQRVAQYFNQKNTLGPKTQKLISQIASINFHPVDSEVQALLLESSLIKKYHPKYNSRLTDDKSYTYICITQENYPRIFATHYTRLPPKAHIYGPFPSGQSVRLLLKTIRRQFPFKSQPHHPPQKCLYCHLNLCPGPNPNLKLYRKNIGKIKKILSGNFKQLERQLKKEMKLQSRQQDYESALQTRNQLNALNYIVNSWHDISQTAFNLNLPSDNLTTALKGLKLTLQPYFKLLQIRRIEAYDISNFGSNYFVGAMSVFQSNKIDNSAFRQFKIRTKHTPDDQFMIQEIISRRLKHTDWPLPDLILVDGGKPQVSAVLPLTTIPVVGLAKREESIILKHQSNWVQINLPLHSRTLQLLQNLRNHAHRFANRYRQQTQLRQFHIRCGTGRTHRD